MAIECVGIIINPRLKDAFAVAEQAAAWLSAKGIHYRCATSRVDSVPTVEPTLPLVPKVEAVRDCDLLLVLGGDGTLLGVARTPGSERVPILAVNVGHLGFLTEVARDEIEVALARVLDGDYATEERMMLEYEIRDEGESKKRGFALNDVVAREHAHLLSLDVFIDDVFFVTVRGDGLIVATPTGSTAYNAAANGPILHPQCEAIVLTPVSSFSLSMRPFVLPAHLSVRIVVRSETPSGFLRADGQEQYPLTQGCEVHAWRAEKTITLVRSHKRDFYDVLRTKLHLGSLPTG